jgi:hypothetical protein
VRFKIKRLPLAGIDEHFNVFHLKEGHYGVWFEFREGVWYCKIDQPRT